MPINQLAGMDQGGPPQGVGQMNQQQGNQEKAVQAVMQATGMFRAAMQIEPGLSVLQPDLEKLTMKVAKYFGYEQEMKLAMQREREQMRAGGPQGMPPMA